MRRITGAMRTTPTSAVEALVGLSSLGLVVRVEARASAHRLWEVGLTFIPIVVIAVYWCGFSNRTHILYESGRDEACIQF
jgi:hypothetical protein